MTVLTIPSKDRKKWRGIFPSTYEGDFSGSWNVDLERFPGRLCLSGIGQVLFRNVAGDTTTVFGLPYGFVTSDADGTSRVWGVTSLNIIRSGATPFLGWSADTYANTPIINPQDIITHGDTDISDTAASKDRVLISLKATIAAFNAKNTVKAWDTDWWTAVDTDGGLAQAAFDDTSGTYGHIFGKIQQFVIVTDNDAIHTIDKNDIVVRRRIVFPPGMRAKCVYTSKDTFWIGLNKLAGGDGLILSWDGSSEQYLDYKFPGTPVSGWVKNGVPHFINQYGQILSLNGDDFEEVAHFPMYEERLSFSISPESDNNGIQRNGCVVEGEIVKIFLGAPTGSRRMRSGIWIFDTKNGNLYHSQSISDFDDTTTRIDYGQPFIFRPGPLFNLMSSSVTRRTIAGGGHYRSYSLTTQVALYNFNTNRDRTATTNRGYFISPVIPANAIQDFFQHFWIKFRPFVHADNRIILKFRTVDPLASSATTINGPAVQLAGDNIWLSTTRIRITAPFSLPAEIKVGHELEILAGRNAGCSFHIASMADTDGVAVTTPSPAATVDVTIDEAAPIGDTFLSLIQIDNWIKIEELSDTSKSFYDFTLPGSDTSDSNPTNVGKFVQFKVELRGKLMEIEEYLPVFGPSLEAQ